jgi:hypothetical protein
MTQPTLESFFSGGGGKSISWKDMPIGTTFGGTIKTVNAPAQQTDPADGKPVFKKDGVTPKMAVRIDLATTLRDPQDPEDDGSRSLYITGWMQGAVGDACRKAGAKTPEVGGQLFVTLTEREPNATNPRLNPTNKFTAAYQAPTAAATQQFFAGQAPQQPGGNGIYQAPALPPAATPPAPAAQPPTMTPEQVAAFMAQQGTAQAPVQQQPVPQPNIAGTGYVQPPAPQQPVAAPLPPRPEALSELAWNAMDDATKRSVAATMANVPPF